MSNSSLNRAALLLLAAAMMLGAGTTIQAHHSFAAQYDSNKPVTLTGVVTKMEWTNPHVYIYIDATDAKTRKVSNWGFEMGPPHMLQKSGWKRNSLKIGDTVEVQGWLARDGSNSGNARSVKRNGEVLGAASSNNQTLTGAGANQAAPPPARTGTP
jgi:Family of unknown function (DUF6152)